MGNISESNPCEDFVDYVLTPNELNEPDDFNYKDLYNNNNYNTKESTNITEKEIKMINKIFKIEKQAKKEKCKKRIGRKRKGDNLEAPEVDKIHSKYDYDNIIRKIQVHFQNFLISFINEILNHFGFKQKFLNIEYNNKKNIKKDTVEKLKSQEIGQILRQNISTKYKKQYKDDKEKNNKLYLEVIKYGKFENLKKILSESYINIFRNCYYKNKKDLNDYGLNIKLSNNVKTFEDLLKNLSKNSEDDKYIEKIKEIVKECYLPKKLFIHN